MFHGFIAILRPTTRDEVAGYFEWLETFCILALCDLDAALGKCHLWSFPHNSNMFPTSELLDELDGGKSFVVASAYENNLSTYYVSMCLRSLLCPLFLPSAL